MNFHEDPINNEAEYKGNVKIVLEKNLVTR